MNYMEKIAEMLGVKLGEKFRVKEAGADNARNSVYVLREKGLYIITNRDGEERTGTAATELVNLLTGRDEIVKIPWKPKDGEVYKYVNANGDICAAVWSDMVFDVAVFLMGNCFRTEAEAEAHKEEMLAKMKEVMGE